MDKLRKGESRLENMIASDIKESTIGIEKILRAEIINVIKNYFIVSNDDVDLDINISGSGRYNINLTAQSRAIRKVKNIF